MSKIFYSVTVLLLFWVVQYAQAGTEFCEQMITDCNNRCIAMPSPMKQCAYLLTGSEEKDGYDSCINTTLEKKLACDDACRADYVECQQKARARQSVEIARMRN